MLGNGFLHSSRHSGSECILWTILTFYEGMIENVATLRRPDVRSMSLQCTNGYEIRLYNDHNRYGDIASINFWISKHILDQMCDLNRCKARMDMKTEWVSINMTRMDMKSD